MDVLIIGGTRFVGYQLAWRLLARGHRLAILNRGTRPDPFGERVERIVADRSTPAFAEALAGRRFDAVVDLASYTGADARGAVAAFGRGRAGHYIHISTGQVYLIREGCPVPAREADYEGKVLPEPADPAEREDWAYGIGKRDAEDVLVDAWTSVEFPSTRLRIPMVNGERDHFRRVESYLWRLLDGGPVILPDGGNRPTRHVYGGAVVDAIDAMLANPSTFGRVYNLAQDETPTLLELVQQLGEILGTSPKTVAIPASSIAAAGLDPSEISPFSHPYMSFLDPALAKAELGFRHEPVRSYLAKIVAVFLNAPPDAPPGNYANRAAEVRLAGGA